MWTESETAEHEARLAQLWLEKDTEIRAALRAALAANEQHDKAMDEIAASGWSQLTTH